MAFRFFKPEHKKAPRPRPKKLPWEKVKRDWVVWWIGKNEHQKWFGGLIKNKNLAEAQEEAKIIKKKTAPRKIPGVVLNWKAEMEPCGHMFF